MAEKSIGIIRQKVSINTTKINMFKKIIFVSLIILAISACKKDQKNDNQSPLFSFGLIADCQYCDETGTGQRKYDQSPEKLRQSVSQLNKFDLEFTMHLGDFIDKNWASYDTVLPIYNRLKDPHFFTLGNHDFSVADSLKGKVLEKLNMKAPYYDMLINGWRFIILNGNDISLYAYSKTSNKYAEAEAYRKTLKEEVPDWSGAVGSAQLIWLKEKLDTATLQEEKVVLFCHFPINASISSHNLWNANEVLALIEQYPQVKAYMNGHNHAGEYDHKDGIHHLTMKGMVDTDSTAYGIVNVFKNRLELKGYGRQQSMVLPF